jgi:hypothetical protein
MNTYTKEISLQPMLIAGLGLMLAAQVTAQTFSAQSSVINNQYCPLPAGATFSYSGYGSAAGTYRDVQVVGEEVVGNVRCMKAYAKGNSLATVTNWYAQDTAGNLWMIDSTGGGPGPLPTFCFPVTLTVGSTFGGIDGYANFTVSSVSQTVSTPYRTFPDCIVGTSDTKTYYIFPGLGMVKDALTNILSSGGWQLSALKGITVHVPPPGVTIATLSVTTIGGGTVRPNDNGESLQVGEKFKVTAVPEAGSIFVNWVAGGSENFVSNNPVLNFTMQSNLTLTANFVTNIFLAAHGSYNGLFAPAGAPREQTNSGAMSFTVTSTGVLSGKLTIGTNTPSLSGQFNAAGAATITTPRKGLTTLTTILQLDLADQSVQGTVSDGSFVAMLAGDQAVFSATRKAINYEGQYTLIIPGTSEPTVGPFGAGYETVSVVASGAITFSGSLADGTTVTPMTSIVSKDGSWPFYLSLYGGNGSLWSWNYFANGAIMSATNASWINATNTTKSALYRAGFTNQAVSIVGSAYNSTDDPLLALTSGQVIFAGGNLLSPITNQFTLTSKNAFILTNALDTNKLTLTINKGLIIGSFANPAEPKQTIKVNGVILQNQTNAQGYFLGTNQSGAFLLGNP